MVMESSYRKVKGKITQDVGYVQPMLQTMFTFTPPFNRGYSLENEMFICCLRSYTIYLRYKYDVH